LVPRATLEKTCSREYQCTAQRTRESPQPGWTTSLHFERQPQIKWTPAQVVCISKERSHECFSAEEEASKIQMILMMQKLLSRLEDDDLDTAIRAATSYSLFLFLFY